MASRDSLLDLTECCLCLCPFTVPRALPCLHSFCESCLENHIIYSRTPAGRFRCPNCRAEYKCPSDGGSHYPLNHLLVSLQNTATICDGKKAGESKTAGNKSEDPKCLAHIGEKMVKVCLECNKAMCRYCMTCEHPSSVVSIKQAAKHVEICYKDLREELFEKKKLAFLRREELAASERTCKVGFENVLEAIRMRCVDMCDKIEQYQKHLLYQTCYQFYNLGDVFLSCREEGEAFESLLDSCISQVNLILKQPDLWAIASYENMADMIEKVILKDVPKFEAGWMFQDGPDITLANVGKVGFASILHPAEVDNADFNMNEKWSESSLEDSQLSVAQHGNSASEQPNCNPTSCDNATGQAKTKPLSNVNPTQPSCPKVIYQRTFYCDGMDLEAKCIRDIVVLKSENLAAITGLQSGQVVIISRTGQLKRLLGASGSCAIENASGLAVFHDGNIAVSDESKGQILVFKENGELVSSLGQGFKRPKGLAVLANGNIAVCYPHDKCVRIFTKGHVSYQHNFTIRTFMCDYEGELYPEGLVSPRYITAFQGNDFVVSDYVKNSVYALTSDARGRRYRCLWQYRGQVFDKKPDLDCPMGVCTDEQGRVLVVDSGNERILVLSSQGKFNKELLWYMTNMPPHLRAISLRNKCLVVGDGFEGSVQMYDYLQ